MAAPAEIAIRFWGVRGSYPTPGSGMVRYGGNTACVEIQAGDSIIILDAGTGIVPLSQSLLQRSSQNGKSFSCLLLFSHLHHDHTQGFPFFTPARIPGADVFIYGPNFLGKGVHRTLEQMMQPPYFPLSLGELKANLAFGEAEEGMRLRFTRDGVEAISSESTANGHDSVQVRVRYSSSHPGGILQYRIDWRGTSVVYATDTEGDVNGDPGLAEFARGADLLIHDAQYTDEHYNGAVPGLPPTRGFGHSTISMACQAARLADVGQLVLFHHAPEYEDTKLDDMAAQARLAFPNTIPAREGLEIYLGG